MSEKKKSHKSSDGKRKRKYRPHQFKAGIHMLQHSRIQGSAHQFLNRKVLLFVDELADELRSLARNSGRQTVDVEMVASAGRMLGLKETFSGSKKNMRQHGFSVGMARRLIKERVPLRMGEDAATRAAGVIQAYAKHILAKGAEHADHAGRSTVSVADYIKHYAKEDKKAVKKD